MWDNEPNMRLRQGGRDAGYKEIAVIKPSKGLNVLGADINVDDKESTNGSKNIEFAEDGIVQKRPGYQNVGTALTNPGKGMGIFKSPTTTYPMTSDGGIVKRLVDGAWTAVSGAVTADSVADVSFTSLDSKTYVWDGVSGGMVFDGTSITRPGTMPRARFSVTYKGYHVASGVDGQPFRVYMAPAKEPSRFTNNVAPTDPDDVAVNDAANVPGATVFTGGNSGQRAIDINRNDGERVTGLGFFQDVLIVFKENSIYQLFFNESDGFVVERISSSYGCVSHSTICAVENDTYFLSDDGVYVLGNEPNYFASIRTNELSSRVKPIIQRISPANRGKCAAVYFDNRYFLTAPVGESNVNTIIVYDRRFYAWAIWDNVRANDMVVHRDGSGDRHFYFTDDLLPRVREFTWGSYNDDGEPINAVFRTKAFDGKMIDREKYWYVIHPVFRELTGDVNISFFTERGQEGETVTINNAQLGGIGLDNLAVSPFGWSLIDTMTDSEKGITGGGSNSTSTVLDASNVVFEAPILIDSRTMKIEFSNDKLNENFALLGWKQFFQDKDMMRMDGQYVYR